MLLRNVPAASVERAPKNDKKSSAYCLTKHGVEQKLSVAMGARAAERKAICPRKLPENDVLLGARVGSAVADYAL